MTDYLGDWSNHDWQRGGMDFAAMRRAGIRGGWHKCADGLNFYQDPYWPEAYRRMRSAFADGCYGAYFVLWGNRDLAGQWAWWRSILDATAPGWRSDPRFVVVLDCEPFGYNQAPTVAQTNQMIDLIHVDRSQKALGYLPAWFYGADVIWLKAPWIQSNYGSNPQAPFDQVYPGDSSSRWSGGGRRADVLQYGSRLTEGDQTTCDADAITVPVATFLSMLQIGGLSVTSPVWDYGDFGPPADPWLRDRDRNLHLAITFADLVGGEMLEHSPYNPAQRSPRTQRLMEMSDGIKSLLASAVADEKRDTTSGAAIQALSTQLATLLDLLSKGGGSPDAAAIISGIGEKIDAAARVEGQRAQQLLDEVSQLKQALAESEAARGQIVAALAHAGIDLAALTQPAPAGGTVPPGGSA